MTPPLCARGAPLLCLLAALASPPPPPAQIEGPRSAPHRDRPPLRAQRVDVDGELRVYAAAVQVTPDGDGVYVVFHLSDITSDLEAVDGDLSDITSDLEALGDLSDITSDLEVSGDSVASPAAADLVLQSGDSSAVWLDAGALEGGAPIDPVIAAALRASLADLEAFAPGRALLGALGD